MKRYAMTTLLLAACATTALAQTGSGTIGDQLARPFIQIGSLMNGTPQVSGPPVPGRYYEDPASIACVYKLQGYDGVCNPNDPTLQNPAGGSQAIAVVDAFDYPHASADLAAFNAQFGIAATTSTSFQVIYAPHGDGAPGSCIAGPASKPRDGSGSGWDLEASLDIEYAHSMAPQATLYLVEAQSNSFRDLFCAVTVASNLVAAAGGGEVSMSWGGGESPAETAFDTVFTTPNVVYFASSGDSQGAYYPSASPNVVSVGGTSISRDPVTGAFINENTWQNAGAGPSRFEPMPGFQTAWVSSLGSTRLTPDLTADANPATGVWVVNSTLEPHLGLPAGLYWFIVGGTSVASPMVAGIVNVAGTFAASSSAENTILYPSRHFRDITRGDCGQYMGYTAAPSFDLCTMNGSPVTYAGK